MDAQIDKGIYHYGKTTILIVDMFECEGRAFCPPFFIFDNNSYE